MGIRGSGLVLTAGDALEVERRRNAPSQKHVVVRRSVIPHRGAGFTRTDFDRVAWAKLQHFGRADRQCSDLTVDTWTVARL